jgi:hypothetical protein
MKTSIPLGHGSFFHMFDSARLVLKHGILVPAGTERMSFTFRCSPTAEYMSIFDKPADLWVSSSPQLFQQPLFDDSHLVRALQRASGGKADVSASMMLNGMAGDLSSAMLSDVVAPAVIELSTDELVFFSGLQQRGAANAEHASSMATNAALEATTRAQQV